MMPQKPGWIQGGSDGEIVCAGAIARESRIRLAGSARIRTALNIDFCPAERIIRLFARQGFLDSFPLGAVSSRESRPQ